MEYLENEIVIKLKFDTTNFGIESHSLINAFDNLESTLYESDREDIERLFDAKILNTLVRDACLERLRQYRHKRIKFSKAETGSIVLVGVVSAISFYIVYKSLLESQSDFKETELYCKLVDFFNERVKEKAVNISKYIETTLKKKNKTIKVEHPYRTKEKNYEEIIIGATYFLDPEEIVLPIQTYGEIFADSHKK